MMTDVKDEMDEKVRRHAQDQARDLYRALGAAIAYFKARTDGPICVNAMVGAMTERLAETIAMVPDAHLRADVAEQAAEHLRRKAGEETDGPAAEVMPYVIGKPPRMN